MCMLKLSLAKVPSTGSCFLANQQPRKESGYIRISKQCHTVLFELFKRSYNILLLAPAPTSETVSVILGESADVEGCG